MNTNERILGIVEDGHLHILLPERAREGATRLTRMDMQVSMLPEDQEIDLGPKEGRALMVEGHESGAWIYSAQVVDEAGPILTAVVRRVFGRDVG